MSSETPQQSSPANLPTVPASQPDEKRTVQEAVTTNQSIVPSTPTPAIIPDFVFAVGCLFFAPKKVSKRNILLDQYINSVENTLSSVSNITNISVTNDIDVGDTETKGLDFPAIDSDEAFTTGTLPIMPINISFDIFIPERIQERLIKPLPKVFNSNKCENFRVRILAAYFCPVTIVEPISPPSNYDVSHSVFFVREFIKEQTEKNNSEFTLVCLGPSPFHASFSVQRDENANPVELVYVNGPYREYTFKYNPTKSDIQSIRRFIDHKVAGELSVYYYITQNERKRDRDWENIKKQYNEILRINKNRGFKSWIMRYFYAQKTSDFFISVTEFQGDEIMTNQEIKRIYRTTFEASELNFFDDIISDTVDEMFKYPSSQFLELIKVFEARREKLVELAIVMISALLGGVVGAIITWAITTGGSP